MPLFDTAAPCPPGFVQVGQPAYDPDTGVFQNECVTPTSAYHPTPPIRAPFSMGEMNVFAGPDGQPINWIVIGLVGLGLILLLKKK